MSRRTFGERNRNPFVDDFGLNTLGFFSLILGMLVVLVGGTITAVTVTDRAMCAQAGRNYNATTHWEFPSGCYVHSENRDVPLDKYITNHQENR